jgi:hypothetical protein
LAAGRKDSRAFEACCRPVLSAQRQGGVRARGGGRRLLLPDCSRDHWQPGAFELLAAACAPSTGNAALEREGSIGFEGGWVGSR